jgi:cardiolipin synthase A/B
MPAWRLSPDWLITGFEFYLFAIVSVGLGLFVLLSVLSREERPSLSFAWILGIVFIPHLTIPAYILFGNRKLRQVIREKSLSFEDQCAACRCEPLQRIARVTSAFAIPRPTAHNRMTFISDGVEAYTRLMDMLDRAEDSIHVQTFILYDDAIGQAVVAKLAERARAGVKVYLLLDAFGSLGTSRRFVKPLREAGGKVGIFMRLLPFQRKWSLNLRNHRKAIIIDESEALIGGMNLGIEYMGPKPDPERWVDTLAHVEGPVVYDLLDEFKSDWEFATDENPVSKRQDRWLAPSGPGGAVAQVIPSGPDVDGDPMYAALIAGILNASRRVWIVTPYFVPDDGLMKALGVGARMGLDIRILVPERSNHPLADLTRSTFLRRLRRDGVKVYFYPHGMMHAKHVVIDDDFALVGTVNLDVRSLLLNFEISMAFYSEPEVAKIVEWMGDLMGRSEIREARPVTLARRLLEQLCFLASPLL